MIEAQDVAAAPANVGIPTRRDRHRTAVFPIHTEHVASALSDASCHAVFKFLNEQKSATSNLHSRYTDRPFNRRFVAIPRTA
jgi:hypothetical protein